MYFLFIFTHTYSERRESGIGCPYKIMNFSIVINQIVVLFVYFLVGFISMKTNILDEHSTKKMTKLIITITMPCFIIANMSKNADMDKSNLLIILGISLIFYLSTFLLSILITNLLDIPLEEKGIHRFMLMFANTGFMGFPVISALWGATGLFNAIIFNLPYNLLVFSIGIKMITNSKPMVKQEKRKLTSIFPPPLMASIVGILLYIFGIQLPPLLSLSLDNVGSITTPLALIIIGASLSSVDIRKMISNKNHKIYALYRLILLPIIVFLFLRGSSLNPTAIATIVVLSGMPTPSNGVILAKQYGMDATFPSESVFISTLLSFFTIPLLVYFISLGL